MQNEKEIRLHKCSICLLRNMRKRKENLQFLKEASDANCSVKLLYKVLDSLGAIAFPHWFIWNCWVLIDLFEIVGSLLRWMFLLEKPLGVDF